MLSWFGNHAPIRRKFDILLVVNLMLTGTAAAAACYAVVEPGRAGTQIVAAALAAVVATVIVALTSKRLVCDPYVNTVVRMEGLAAGDLTSPIAHADNRDCVGRMTKAMMVFRRNAEQVRAAGAAQQQVVSALGDGLARLAANDLTGRIDDAFPADYEKLRLDYNAAMDAVDAAMQTIATATTTIRRGADEISQASDDLSMRTEQQAASLEETAAAMTEVTDAVRRTATEAVRASDIAREARQVAEQGGAVVDRAVEAMNAIERSSAEIADVISMIDGIAFQTNLLALNAGVEAARAGEAGRGFAVVASEVRALAQRSADAARDVKARINTSATQVQSGVQLVNETGAVLRSIIGGVAQVTDAVSSIAIAAEQQSSGLQQVNTAVGEMDNVTQQNAAMVEEATAAARGLNGQADELAREVGRFRLRRADTNVVALPTPSRSAATRTDRAPLRRVAGGGSVVNDEWSAF